MDFQSSIESGENPWAQYFDEEGSPYWYNSTTGESQYDAPA